MAQPWFAGNADPWAEGGYSGPDPVTLGDTSWTWDVEFPPAGVYARTSLNRFANIGGGSGWVLSGIVAYTTRNADGSDSNHLIGQGNSDGLADYAWDSNVDSVTFGWTIEGDNYCIGNINMEIWS